MRSQPMCGPRSKLGAIRMACRKIHWLRSERADIWNGSPRNGPPVIHKTCRPMPSSEPGKPYLAFDFGAESGRAVLARLHSGVLTTEEVHRFPNEPVEYSGSLHWDVARLWLEGPRTLSKLEEIELSCIGGKPWGDGYTLPVACGRHL